MLALKKRPHDPPVAGQLSSSSCGAGGLRINVFCGSGKLCGLSRLVAASFRLLPACLSCRHTEYLVCCVFLGYRVTSTDARSARVQEAKSPRLQRVHSPAGSIGPHQPSAPRAVPRKRRDQVTFVLRRADPSHLRPIVCFVACSCAGASGAICCRTDAHMNYVGTALGGDGARRMQRYEGRRLSFRFLFSFCLRSFQRPASLPLRRIKTGDIIYTDYDALRVLHVLPSTLHGIKACEDQKCGEVQ